MEEYERCVRIWKNWVRSAPEEITNRLPNFQKMQSFHSTKLEYPDVAFNTAAPVWDTSRLVGYTGSVHGAIALHNHKVAHALLDRCLEDGIPLSVDLICGVQHALSCGLYDVRLYVHHEDRPGEFKQADQVEGLVDVGASPEEIEDTLEMLVDEMPRIADMNDTLVAAAYLQARLLFLRPFALANGPTSRLVMNYWLQMQKHPPVMIPSSESRAYREALESFDVREDIEPLTLFLCDQVVGFWSDQMTAKEQGKKKPGITLRF